MKLIYEKSQAGPPRPRGADARTCRCRRCRQSSHGRSRRACRSSPSPRCSATSRSSRRATSASTPASIRSASCTMKYNPRVNERVVGLPGFAHLHPLVEDDAAQGALELEWELQNILLEVTGLDAVSACSPRPGSQGELTGPDALPRVLRGPRRGRDAPEDRHPRHRARHEPRERDDGGLRADAGEDRRAREHRRRGSARQGRRAHGGLDADEPVDARALRREHRGDPRHLPRRRRAHVLRRREPERGLRHLAAGRHGLRRRAHQPAQDVLAAARRRRSRAAARSPCARASSRSCRCRSSSRTATRSGSTTTGRSRSARCARSPARSASSSAPTRSFAPTGRRCAR